MFRLFGGKSVLGIDLGSRNLKIVQLEKRREQITLSNYGILTTTIEAFEKTGLMQPQLIDETLSKLIEGLLKAMKPKTREAYFTVPFPFVFSTSLDLPPVSERELARAIPFEARRYIPVSLDEVRLEWRSFQKKNIFEDMKPQWHVFLVATPKEIIEKLKRIARLSRLSFRDAECEVFSIPRINPTTEGVSLMFGLGARYSLFVFAHGRSFISAKMSSLSGYHFTRTIAQSLGVGTERAEEMKMIRGLNFGPEDGNLKDVVGSVFMNFVNALRQELEKFEADHQLRVERVTIIGEDAPLPGFIDQLATQMPERLVTSANPFLGITTPPQLSPVLNKEGMIFAQATGISLKYFEP